MLTLIVVVVILLLIINVALVAAVLGKQSAVATSSTQASKNISLVGNSIENSINTKLNVFTVSSSNTIKASLDNTTATISGYFNSENINRINDTTGINKNISDIKDDLKAGEENITNNINLNLSIFSNTIISNVNAILEQRLANISKTSGSEALTNNTIKVWTMDQNITPGNWIVYGLPDTFTSKIEINSSAPITAVLVSIYQFANFSNGKTYGNEGIYTSTGSFNTISFSTTLPTGCSLYELLIAGNPSINENITLYPNVSATFEPSSTLQGVCRS